MAAAGRSPSRSKMAIRRGATESRTPAPSGQRWGAGLPWALTATSAGSCSLFQSSGLSLLSPHQRPPGPEAASGRRLLPSALRCGLDSQPFRLPSGSPAWDPREGSLKHRLGHPRAFDFEVWWGLGMCISAGSRVVPQIWDPR